MSEPESPPPVDLDPTLWPTDDPPAGFASRVVGEFFGDPAAPEPARDRGPRPRPRRALAWVGATMATAAAVALMWWTLGGRAPVRDALVAQSMQTVQLHDRAVAVVEPGTVLAWQVESDGATRIDQDAGRVFYRVDHGESFEVITPLGTVTVTGTCFGVDLVRTPTFTPTNEPTMRNQAIKAGAAGAALATALVVTVYEGSVVLANDQGTMTVKAGEAGTARLASAPVRSGADDPPEPQRVDPAEAGAGAASAKSPGDPRAHLSRQARVLERMRTENGEQAERIRVLEAQVESLGGSIDRTSPEAIAARAKQCAKQTRGGGCPFLEPNQETLLEMAKCATVKVDSPGFLDDPDAPVVAGLAKMLGVEDTAELDRLQAAADKHYESYNAQLRAMYLELGGSEEIAADASGDTLFSSIADQLDPELTGAVQRRIAQERAGLQEPPATLEGLPIEERLLRLQANKGNVFEQHVAEALGPERARALRSRADGWPGSTSVYSSDCIE